MRLRRRKVLKVVKGLFPMSNHSLRQALLKIATFNINKRLDDLVVCR
jgi:hypothetical protein